MNENKITKIIKKHSTTIYAATAILGCGLIATDNILLNHLKQPLTEGIPYAEKYASLAILSIKIWLGITILSLCVSIAATTYSATKNP